jgi:hypothetical protein
VTETKLKPPAWQAGHHSVSGSTAPAPHLG